MSLPDDRDRVALLVEDCAAAVRQVDHADPPTLARLASAVEALDAALPAASPCSDAAALPAVRDALGDHLVALGAAGLPLVERQAVATSLAALLAETGVVVGAGRSSGDRSC